MSPVCLSALPMKASSLSRPLLSTDCEPCTFAFLLRSILPSYQDLEWYRYPLGTWERGQVQWGTTILDGYLYRWPPKSFAWLVVIAVVVGSGPRRQILSRLSRLLGTVRLAPWFTLALSVYNSSKTAVQVVFERMCVLSLVTRCSRLVTSLRPIRTNIKPQQEDTLSSSAPVAIEWATVTLTLTLTL